MKICYVVCAVLFALISPLNAMGDLVPAVVPVSKKPVDKKAEEAKQRASRSYHGSALVGRATGPGLRLSVEDLIPRAPMTSETGVFATYLHMPKVSFNGVHLTFVGIEQTIWARATSIGSFMPELGMRGTTSLGYFYMPSGAHDVISAAEIMPMLRIPVIPERWSVSGGAGLRASYTILAKMQTTHTWQVGTSLEF